MSRKMKDSGVEWIGEIPEEWSIVKVKSLFELGRGRVIAQTELKEDGLYPVYSSQTKNNGCLGYIDTYDLDKNQLTWTTDGANAGTVFLREGKYNCTNVCGTLLPRTNDNLKFLKYDLEYIAIYHKRLDTNGYKIMNNEMAEIRIVRPELSEQNKIANYLDSKCTKIDQTIEKEKEVIEKLKEYKQSVITEAVTKGLNSDVKMKDSGVEWIGDIPEHWRICRLKNYASICNGQDYKGILDENGIYPVMGSGGAFAKANDFIYNKPSVLLGRKGTIDKPLYVDYPFWTVDTMYYTIINEKNYVKFFYYLCKTINFEYYQYGSAVPSMTQRDLNNIIFANPKLEEQKEIADYLDKKCSAIDKLITNKEKVIEKLTEYKKSLIYECVTGKREV